MDNDTEYTLEIDKDIVDAEVDFTASDFEVPVAQSIELTGPSTFEVTYSEPIDSESAFVVEIEDGIYSGVATGDDSNVVVVDMGVSSLDDGDYAVEISGATDFAGYTAPKKNFTLKYATNDSEPVAKIVSADRTEVEIEWNVEVEGADGGAIDENYFYHSYSSYNPDSVEVDGTTYTLHFDTNPLPEGDVKIVIEYDAVDDEEITSVWGVEMTGDQILTAKIVDDSTKPEVTEVEVDDEQTVILHFSEGLNVATAEDLDNYVVKDDEGEEVDVDDATYDADDETVTLTFGDVLDGDYTIDISDVEDDALIANEMVAVTKSFTVTDQTGIDLTAITAEVIDGTGSAHDTIIVRFPDDMSGTGTYSVLSKDNYQISLDGGTTYKDLDSDDTIAFFGGEDAVKISIDDNSQDLETLAAAGTDKVKLLVGRLADSLGNKSDLLSAEVDADPATGVNATSAVMKTYKTVEITYEDTVVTSAPVTAFEINGTAGNNPAGVRIAYDKEDSIITLTLKAAQQIDDEATDLADGAMTVKVIADKVKFDTGVYANAEAAVAVTDGIAPEIDTIDQTAADQITVTFTENVDVTSLALAATDLVIKDADGDALVAGVDYVVTEGAGAAGDTTLVIDFDVADDNGTSTSPYEAYEDDLTIDTKDSVNYIYDADGEAEELAAYGTAKKVAVDQTAPTVSVASVSATQVKFVLSEAIADASTGVALADNADASAYVTATAAGGGTIDTAVYDKETKTILVTVTGTWANTDKVTLDASELVDLANLAVPTKDATLTDGAWN